MTDKQTITVEGQVTAVDTLTALTTYGAENPTRKVDVDGTHIRQMSAAFSSDGAGVGEAVFGVKLSGDGMRDTQRIFIGAGGGQNATGLQDGMRNFVLDTSMPVNGGNVITVEATMAGVDTGTATVTVSLIIADGAPPARTLYASVEGTVTAVDSLTAMTTFGADTGQGPIPVNTKAQQMTRQWVVGASNSAAVGEGNAFVRISGTGLGKSGNFDFAGPGYGGTLNTSSFVSTEPGITKFVFDKVEANDIIPQAMFTGIDPGQWTIGFTAEFILAP